MNKHTNLDGLQEKFREALRVFSEVDLPRILKGWNPSVGQISGPAANGRLGYIRGRYGPRLSDSEATLLRFLIDHRRVHGTMPRNEIIRNVLFPTLVHAGSIPYMSQMIALEKKGRIRIHGTRGNPRRIEILADAYGIPLKIDAES